MVRPLHWCLGDMSSHDNVSVDGPSSKHPELPCQPDILVAYSDSRGSRYFEKLTKHLNFLPPANDVCEGHVFTGVRLSTGGRVSASGPSGGRGRHPLGPEANTHPGYTSPSLADTPCACWYTVNKRAVRIPLEMHSFYQFTFYIYINNNN